MGTKRDTASLVVPLDIPKTSKYPAIPLRSRVMSVSATYRPELDGIRAIAVLAVVLYHLDMPWISGGFVGVDVFFVLSGYLITGVLSRELGGDSFRFREFFLKRLRRLLPALLAMTTVVLAAASVVLLPVALEATAWSVLAQPFALQNVFFLLDGDYFADSRTKLLLHTWSLGIEEQFYLIWPLLLFFLARRRVSVQLAVLVALIGFSFAMNIAVMAYSPKVSFFLLPTRAWELGLGGLLALVELRMRGGMPRIPATLCYLMGLATLVWSFMSIRGGLTFPGWWAVVPAMGTVLLLGGISGVAPWGRRALALPPVVWLGRLSYSLYLWHWPVIVFARRAGAEISAPSVAVLLLLVSLGLAYASFRLVEEPIRRRNVLQSDRSLLRAVAVWVGILLIAATSVIGTQGLALRYSGNAREFLTVSLNPVGEARCGDWFRLVHRDAAICPLGDAVERPAPRKVLLWGNSHAAMWVELFEGLAVENQAQSFLSVRNCRATLDNDFCGPAYQQAVLAEIHAQGITDVVLASSWHGIYGIPDEVFEPELIRIVETLAALPVRVWLVVGVPRGLPLSPELQYQLNPADPEFGMITWEDFSLQRDPAVRLFEGLAARFTNVRVLDPTESYCEREVGCKGGDQGVAWFMDTNHLTAAGAERARGVFQAVFAD